jgi:hypothetical protein
LHIDQAVPKDGGEPVEVQLLHLDMGTTQPLAAVASRYDL